MNSSKLFSLKLFGSPLLTAPDGIAVTGRAVQRHRVALLALLELAPGRALSRDKVVGYLWPESDAEHARRLLNQAVYQLRRTLGDAAIVSTAEELRLNSDVVRSDVAEFEAALAENDPARAAAWYRGPFLDGFFLSNAPEFDRWGHLHRERLAGAYAKALEAMAEQAERAGDLPAAVELWKRRAVHDPYDSSVALRLISMLERQGNRAGALQHAVVHERLLLEEFGIAPPPELAAVTQRLREDRGERGVATRNETGPAAIRDVPTDGATARASVDTARDQGSAAQTTPIAPAPATVARAGASRGLGYALTATALAAVLIGAAVFWFAGRDDERWLTRSALPEIEKHLDVADWETAYGIAREAEKRFPDNRALRELWPRITWDVTIHSQPEGAAVFRQAYNAPADKWEELGRTPLTHIRIPYGVSRIRFELAGYQPLIRALGGAHLNWRELRVAFPDILLVGPENYRLDTEQTLPRDMVRVPAWKLIAGDDLVAMNDFFIGRYEVTNAEYKAFVDAGGYSQPGFWDPIVIDGDSIPWRVAMQRFVDRTGRPGPSTWEAGDYPAGQADYPVSGVSWYEAQAYARFTHRELPTAHHWQEALANALFPWQLPLSNFNREGPRRVTASRAMSHVGAYDLTGNVREWTSSSIGSERVILGGSWNDPYYIAGLTDASARPEDRSAGNGIRLAITRDSPASARLARAPLTRTTTAPPVRQQPVSDAVYAAYSRVFDYDRGPLNATVDAVDTTRLWIRELIQFAAGYGDERTVLHLYLPTHARPPFQVVVYWPGWDTFALDDADEYFAKQIDFIVKSGRAVAFPIYRGIFERKNPKERRRAEFGTAAYRDNTIYTVKDLRRTVDYLETRPDIKRGAYAFFGYSWGGVNGPTALAQEPRIRVGVIDIGLLPPMSATPEVDPVNALPRVRIPTLMFSGEFDPMVPRDNSDRYFALLGTAPDRKRHVIAIGGHFIPRDLLIRETLDWLDQHLGRVELRR